MFNPEHLATLQAVVEEGTVLAAADRLGITASAVSQQLSRLQRDTGQPVMARRGRSLEPTDATAVLVRTAQQMRDLDESARAELERLRQDVGGTLVVSGFPTALYGLLAPLAARLQQRHPELELTVRELSPEESVPAVRRGEVDLAVVHDWTDRHVPLRNGVQVWPVGLDPVDLVVPRDHHLRVRARGVDLEDLDGQVWIDDSPGVFSDWLLSALEARNVGYRVGATVDTATGKVALTACGFGLCLLPRLGREGLPPDVVALPLAEAPTRRVLAVHRDSSHDRPAVQAALSIIREVWAQYADLPDSHQVAL